MLINYNKVLMEKGGAFPFSVPLVMIHSAVSTLLTGVLFFLVPSWFPSLTGPNKVNIDFDLIVRGAMPIAMTFSISLVLSNTAYVHSDVSFLQMMKEFNVVIVYFMSIMCALERFEWKNVIVLGFIATSTFFCLKGAVSFDAWGFLMQFFSQIAECLKITLQAFILSSAGKKLDVLSYVLIVMPLCFVFLSGAFGILYLVQVEDGAFSMPTWLDVYRAWPLLWPNALLAFALNVVIAFFMKSSSGVTFVLAGILKDVCIVLVSVLFMEEFISQTQVISFSAQVFGIFVWAMMKLYPVEFQRGLVPGLSYAICGQRREEQTIPDAEAALKT